MRPSLRPAKWGQVRLLFDFLRFFFLQKKSANYLICAVTVFHFLNYMLVQIQIFLIFPNYLVMQLQFFFAGLNFAQVFFGRVSWNRCTSTPHRSEINGIAERAVRRVKEGTSAVLLQSGLHEKWWADSMECYCYLRNLQDLLSDVKTFHERRCCEPVKGPGHTVRCTGWISADFC